jgi:AcrR family transcriptional regulator
VTATDRQELADARAERSRRALLGAFRTLVQEQPYSSLTIRQVVSRSGVARSTFYEHFRNKDHLLVASMDWPFSVLAANALGRGSLAHNIRLLQHFWEKRGLARFLRPARLQHRLLVGLSRRIETGLPAIIATDERGLMALQLAASQWVPVMSWLDGGFAVTPEALAGLLLGCRRTPR